MMLSRLLGRPAGPGVDGCYAAIVAEARRPSWYLEGGVPDTIDGRFDMVAAVLATVLLRLERDPDAAAASAMLTERFVTDMDGQLREMGVGDIVVGKHIGKMMSMLGGRIGAYRSAETDAAMDEALVRNVYRGETPDASAVAHVRDALAALARRLDPMPLDAILTGHFA